MPIRIKSIIPQSEITLQDFAGGCFDQTGTPAVIAIHEREKKHMVKIKTLDCGVTVVLDHLADFNSAAVGIWVRTGAVNEEKRISGISHLIEHMMFKGTEKRNALQIAEDVDKIGGQINAFTGKEATCYYIKTLSDNLDTSLEILLDMFTNSVFDKTELEREKLVVMEEMKMINDAPDELALDIIGEEIFKGLPLGNSIIGTPASLKRIKQSTIREYINKQYTKDSIVVSVAGKFDENKVCEKLEKELDFLNPEKPEPEYPKIGYVPSFKVKVKDIEQSHLCLAARSIRLDDDRYYALTVLNNIMGGSMSSRLFQSIREKKGLAYSVFSANSSASRMGFFNIYAGIGHEKVRDTVRAIKEELALLQQNSVSEDELSKAKEQLKSGYIFGQENVNSRMFANGKNVLLRGKTTDQETVIRKINEVTVEDVDKIKSMICDTEKYSGVLVTNKRVDLRRMFRGQ